jgi:thymidylate kinase
MRQDGLLICFTGIDGSGKTTQAKLLLDWLKSNNIKSIYVWSRGEVLIIRRLFLFFGRSLLGTTDREIASDEKAHREYQSRKSKLMENSLVRILWSVMTYVEHLIQINLEIRPKLRDGCAVVCDRYLWDSSIDMATLNNKDPEWLSGGYNRLVWKFVPKPTITFFIDIPTEEAMKRKNDIPSVGYVRQRAELYRYLAGRNSFSVIDGRGDAAAIQSEIIRTVNSYIGS